MPKKERELSKINLFQDYVSFCCEKWNKDNKMSFYCSILIEKKNLNLRLLGVKII